MTSANVPLPDSALEQQQVWASANLARIGAQHVLGHELLVHSVDVHAGQRVLDVGAGTGNAAVAAARRGAEVTAIDLVEELLGIAQRRAGVEGFTITTRVADAQDLPFPDSHFDVVLSAFAVMFAPDPHKAASELFRVCRHGGRIGLTAWTPEGFVGQHMSTMAHYQSHSGGTNALRWGEENWVRQILTGRSSELRTLVRNVDMCHRSPGEAIESQRRGLGPVRATFDALDRDGQQALTEELKQVIARFNRATDGTVVVAAEYLESVAVRSI